MMPDHPNVVPPILVHRKETNYLCFKGILGLMPDAALDCNANGLAPRMGLTFCPLILTPIFHMGIAQKPAIGGSK